MGDGEETKNLDCFHLQYEHREVCASSKYMAKVCMGYSARRRFGGSSSARSAESITSVSRQTARDEPLRPTVDAFVA